MTKSPHLLFNSSLVHRVPGEDAATNPGIFGKSFAAWIADSLEAIEYQVDKVIAEDFAWCVPVRLNNRKVFVACASETDPSGGWRVFVFSEPRSISQFFSKDVGTNEVAEIFGKVKEMLLRSGLARDLREVEL
jgi:hypothetical protein